jgi:DNA polymerase III subunit gamma/tau
MPYQVLARTWRPQTFKDLIGQTHVTHTLMHALEQNRLHHAYLFTGTRGVGKTSLARLLAKCLNCEAGISANPCRKCETCQAIEKNHHPDLFEIDAASRTKVEDTRELLNNVPYAPTQSRFKIYIIDEVHMLSNHSFNALLKTLEEPPAHVKFFLATTEPDKLPITILSRCLQLHLKPLAASQLTQHLSHILKTENIPFEETALDLLSHAAKGSVRDALSLLDQSIAYTNQNLNTVQIAQMLGKLPSDQLLHLLSALFQKDLATCLEISEAFLHDGIDFITVLEDLIRYCHHICLLQADANLALQVSELETLKNFAKAISPKDLQLYYEIALAGQTNLALAPDQKIGFDMILLQMIAFTNATSENLTPLPKKPQEKVPPPKKPSPAIQPAINTIPTPASMPLEKINPVQQTAPVPVIQNTHPTLPSNSDDWLHTVSQLSVRGLTQVLMSHLAFYQRRDLELVLHLENKHAAVLNDTQKQRLTDLIRTYYQQPITLTIELVTTSLSNTAEAQATKKITENKAQVIQTFQADPLVQDLMNTFSAKPSYDKI